MPGQSGSPCRVGDRELWTALAPRARAWPGASSSGPVGGRSAGRSAGGPHPKSRARPGTFSDGRLGTRVRYRHPGGTGTRTVRLTPPRQLPRPLGCPDRRGCPARSTARSHTPGRCRGARCHPPAARRRGPARRQVPEAGRGAGARPWPVPARPGPARTRSQLSSRPEEGSQAGSQGVRTPNLARVTRNVRGRAAGGRGMRALAPAAQAPGQSGLPHCARCPMVSTSQIGPDGPLSDTVPRINPLPVQQIQRLPAADGRGFRPVSAKRFSGTPCAAIRCDLERSGSHSHLFWTRGTAPSGSPAPLNSNPVRIPEGRAKAGRLQDRAAASAMMPSARPAPSLTGPRDRTVASRPPRHRPSAGIRGVLTGAEAARHRASGTEPAVPANPDPASGGTVARRQGSPGAPWTSQARRTGTPRRTRRRRGTRPRRASRLGLGHHARPAVCGSGPERARAAAFGPAPRRSRPRADHPT
jgi:hypothetical protein